MECWQRLLAAIQASKVMNVGTGVRRWWLRKGEKGTLTDHVGGADTLFNAPNGETFLRGLGEESSLGPLRAKIPRAEISGKLASSWGVIGGGALFVLLLVSAADHGKVCGAFTAFPRSCARNTARCGYPRPARGHWAWQPVQAGKERPFRPAPALSSLQPAVATCARPRH